jgi:hypothetical protein
LTAPPFEAGHFIWCNFPLSEFPDSPGLEHVVYIMGVIRVTAGSYAALVAYTTSQTMQDPLPIGVLRFNKTEAISMGHNRPFLLYSGRLGHLPVKRRRNPWNAFRRLHAQSHQVARTIARD